MSEENKINGKKLIGIVKTDKMEKTRLVEITRMVKDPLYQKSYAKSNKIQAHDEENIYKVGDMVEIREVKPISKNKAWKIIRKIK